MSDERGDVAQQTPSLVRTMSDGLDTIARRLSLPERRGAIGDEAAVQRMEPAEPRRDRLEPA